MVEGSSSWDFCFCSLGCVFVALRMVHGCFVSIDLHRGSNRNSTCHLYFTFCFGPVGGCGTYVLFRGCPGA